MADTGAAVAGAARMWLCAAAAPLKLVARRRCCAMQHWLPCTAAGGRWAMKHPWSAHTDSMLEWNACGGGGAGA